VRLGARRASAVSFVCAALAASQPAVSAPPQKPPPSKPAPSKPAKPAPPPPVAPVGPLTMLPSIARVQLTSHGKVVSVAVDVNLPRGDWKGEALRFHVAYGAPGPRAIDARLLAVGDGELEADDEDAGEALTVERVPRRPPNAHPLLGRDALAGVVVLVPSTTLTSALERGNMATLRIRSLVDLTEADASGASSVVVRLGASRGTPLTLGRISATAATPAPPITQIEAKLCGPEAEPRPLAVALVPRPAERDRTAIAPVLAVRHASDDLCLRFWQSAVAKTP
jgi:hypothetical protein